MRMRPADWPLMRAMRVSNREAGKAIRMRVPFQGSNLRGVEGNDESVTQGYLPADESWEVPDMYFKPRYIVLSYDTPIAWWYRGEGWTVPDVKYSPTTSKHQNIVRRAIA